LDELSFASGHCYSLSTRAIENRKANQFDNNPDSPNHTRLISRKAISKRDGLFSRIPNSRDISLGRILPR